MSFRHFNKLFHFVVSRKNHINKGPDCGKCYIFSEKQACITRRQALELFENMFVQVVLSLLANVKPIFSIKKHFSMKPFQCQDPTGALSVLYITGKD